MSLVNLIHDSLFGQTTEYWMQSLSVTIWLFGGLLDDPYIYLIGILSSVFFYLLSIFQEIRRNGTLDAIPYGITSKLLFGSLAYLFYFKWGNQGPPQITAFSISIDVNYISIVVLASLFIVWVIGRSFDTRKWLSKLDLTSYFLLTISGIFKLFLLIFAVRIYLGFNFPYSFYEMVFASALLDPIIVYFFHKRNFTLSSFELAVSDKKFPANASLNSCIMNIFYLSLGIYWGEDYIEEAKLIRAILIMFLLFFFTQGRSSLQKFAKNPLQFSPIGDILEETPELLSRINPDNTPAYIVASNERIGLNSDLSIDLPKNSLIIPLKETKGKIEVAVIGSLKGIDNKHGLPSVENLEGITLTLFPKKTFKTIVSKSDISTLSKIDFDALGLPNLESIQNLLQMQTSKIKNWTDQVTTDLTKFNPGNLSIHTENGFTNVNLGLIQVLEHEGDGALPGFTRFKMPGIRVLETEQGTIVKLFGYDIFDHPDFSFVNLPGITVIDFEGKGTVAKIFGIKVGDNLNPEKIDELKNLSLSLIAQFEKQFDSGIGRLLSRKKSLPLFNISFAGEFRPLFASPSNEQIVMALPPDHAMQMEKSNNEPPLLTSPDYEIIDEEPET